MANSNGSTIKGIARIEKQDILIVDDFGIQPYDPQNRTCLLAIIEDRHGKRSAIFTLELPIKQLYDARERKNDS